MLLDLGPVSLETFCATYWRRRPLYVPGGARALLEATLEPPQFLAACERLERVAPNQLFRRGPGLAFAQRVDLTEGLLHRVSERFAGRVAGAQIWFDGVYAREGMGIGSHFDFADTFLLQQRGTKLWRLHPPSFLPDHALRRRLLNETEVDAMIMPDGAVEFRLDEGDLLYLPLLWVHWGVSEGESLSLSLSFTARLGLDCLNLEGLAPAGGFDAAAVAEARASLWRASYPQPNPTQVPPAGPLPAHVRATLAHDARWWRPLPTIWAVEGEDAVAAATRAQAEAHVDALAASLPELAEAWQNRPARPAAGGAARPTRYGAAPRGDGPGALPGLDELLRAASALPEPPVDPAALAAPDRAFDETTNLRARVARRCLGRFLRIAQRSHEWVEAEALKPVLPTLLRALSRVPPEQSAEALRHAALRGWSWRAAEAIQAGYVPRLEAVVAQLPRLLLPLLLDADALAPGDALPVTPGAARSLPLLSWGLELPAGRALGEVLEARREPNALVLAGAGATLCLEPSGPGGAWRPREGSFEPLTPAWPGGPPMCGDDAWVHGFFPASERARGLALRRDGDPEGRAALADALSAGHAWLSRQWPAWAPRVARAFELVAAREDAADEPPWQSTRAFAGLLAAAARGPEATAQTLVREAARRLAYDALDGVTLIEESPREAFLAWSGRGASLAERVADLLTHALLLGAPAGPPGPGASGRQALAAAAEGLRGEPGLTAAGSALLDGIARAITKGVEGS